MEVLRIHPTMRLDFHRMHDTLPEAEIVRRDAVRRLDPLARLRQAFELSDALRRLQRLGLRERALPRGDAAQVVDVERPR